jgi:hypothetical protein
LPELKPRLRAFLEVILYSLAGSVPVAGFFILAFFPGYVPFSITETGTILILTPLFVGILFGFMLSERDLRAVAAGTLVIVISSSILVTVFIMSPILAGVASAAPAAAPGEVLEIYVAQRILLFIVLSFPVLLLGAVVGRALSERVIPNEELRRELEQLRKETREWHELLKRKGELQDRSETGIPKLSVKQDNDAAKPR